MKSLMTGFLLLCVASIKAQSISPTDLFQINKYWQMNITGFDKNTYDYVVSVDSHWGLRIPPQKDKGLQLLFGYFKDKKWFQDEECRLMLTYDNTQGHPKAVMYLFTDENTWAQYNKQMVLMNANSLASQDVQGGKQSVYAINGITIYLTEFPPGINGVDRTYQVLITD